MFAVYDCVQPFVCLWTLTCGSGWMLMMLELVFAVLVRTESFLMTREQRQVRVSRQGIDRATSRSGGRAERRRQQLERMAGSQKPFVRLVASARCKNNCIKWPRTETGLERFSHLVRESCETVTIQFSLAPSLACLTFGQCKRSNRKKTSLPLAGDATEMQRWS